MHPILRNIIAFIVGLIAGGIVNMGLIKIGMSVIPAPDGVDVNDAKSIAAHIHLFQFKHFITPFLAHAMGTLASAFMAAKLAATHKMTWAWVMGGMGLLGGIAACFMIPAPTWFIVLDLAVAYLPMAWLGGIFATRRAA